MIRRYKGSVNVYGEREKKRELVSSERFIEGLAVEYKRTELHRRQRERSDFRLLNLVLGTGSVSSVLRVMLPQVLTWIVRNYSVTLHSVRMYSVGVVELDVRLA